MTDMFECAFRFREKPVSVRAGASFHEPRESGFSDANAAEMQSIIAAVRGGSPWRQEIDRRFGAGKRWLRDIILSPKRQAFFPLLSPSARRVLDLGCGWGQMTLPLAASGREVVALEPGPHRLAFVEAAAAQDRVAQRIAFVGADYLDCEFGPMFDAILCIGVLEWAGTFRADADPRGSQRELLSRARRQLAPGGALILGIENRIGVKYLLGCPDDHLGVAGVACLPADLAKARWKATTGHDLRSFTFSEAELREMLDAAGFSDVRFFGAFPDYKLPDAIVPLENDGSELNARLHAGMFFPEHNGYDGSPLTGEFNERIHAFYGDAARVGIAQHFAPSFFVVAR